jgi:hypothetical protein
MAGEISELMKWYEVAHARFERIGFVDIKNQHTRNGMGFPSKGEKPARQKRPKWRPRVQELLDQGLSAKQISERLGCSRQTVSDVKCRHERARAGSERAKLRSIFLCKKSN